MRRRARSRGWGALAAGAVAVAVVVGGCSEDDPMEPAACYARDLSTTDICDLLGDACAPAAGSLPAISDHVQVAPSVAMPEGVVAQPSHNNLDIIWFENRLFFAFRTSRTHFASRDTVMYVVSTTDQRTWTLETFVFNEWDLREPRFLAIGDRLFLYFAVLGDSPVTFDPQFAMVTEYTGPCAWTEPEQILDPEFIPWRTKTVNGVPYMVGYVGGDNIYEMNGDPIRVSWLTTEDGRTFTPVVPGQPVVLEGGSSETDFVFTDDGGIVAVSRNEAGDELGFGMKICRAEPESLGDWQCVSDPKKYDSPLLFRHGDEIYLIGRRNVSDTGNYDLMMDELPLGEQARTYQVDYWTRPKRCSLWRVDAETLAVEHVLDLPSNGDTCFPGVVELGGGQFLVYNYTSPLDDPELEWVEGQTGSTFIYQLTLTLP